MRHIGPYFAQRMRQSRLYTYQHVVNRMNRLNRVRNEQWMRRVFTNRQATLCVDPTHIDRELAPNRDYAVYTVNMKAYNQIIDYARAHGVPAARIPRKIRRRPLLQKYPARCATI
jgi:hypothetical protein